jgi:hypothetical protein
MGDGRDFYRGETGSVEGRSEVERPSRNDSEVSQRARYLAKAASLGQVVLDDEPPAAER